MYVGCFRGARAASGRRERCRTAKRLRRRDQFGGDPSWDDPSWPNGHGGSMIHERTIGGRAPRGRRQKRAPWMPQGQAASFTSIFAAALRVGFGIVTFSTPLDMVA